MAIIGVLKEPNGEHRVAATPDTVAFYIKNGHQVLVEQDAGADSFISDEQYSERGATMLPKEAVIEQAQILLSICNQFKEVNNKILVGIFSPLTNRDSMQLLAGNGCTTFSLDALPRTTRAQAMDVLSSQGNIAGYKAVLTAACAYSRYFPMFMTAAGSIPPAKVLILGAGVAGLQAIATARRLGAVVEVFDTRPAVKEEVMSLGAKFVEVEGAADASAAGGYAVEQTEEFKLKQRERIAQSAAKSDIIITTAQIPGRSAPILITDEMLGSMRPGAVIVDLAASTGGNTQQTKPAQTILYSGVTIIGDSALPNSMPADASKLLAKNFQNFLQLILAEDGAIQLNFEDDLVKGCCITHEGAIVYDRLLG